MNQNIQVKGAIAVASAVLWVGSFDLHNRFLTVLSHAPGIDLIFVPSGIRLIAIMVGGVWAALGVTVGSLFLTGTEFGISNVSAVLAVALCAGFCPFAALRATMWALGIDGDLKNLRPGHLPLISLGVAAGSSLLHNLIFCALGIEPWRSFADHFLAMAAGDFAGILLAVITVFLVLRLFRRPAA